MPEDDLEKNAFIDYPSTKGAQDLTQLGSLPSSNRDRSRSSKPGVSWEALNGTNGNPDSTEEDFQDAESGLNDEKNNYPSRGVAQKSPSHLDKRMSKRGDEPALLQGSSEHGYIPDRVQLPPLFSQLSELMEMVQRQSGSEDRQRETPKIHFQQGREHGKGNSGNQQQKNVQNEDQKDLPNETEERDFAPAPQDSHKPDIINMAKLPTASVPRISRVPSMHRAAIPLKLSRAPDRGTNSGDIIHPERDPQVSSGRHDSTRVGWTATEIPRVTADDLLNTASRPSEDFYPSPENSSHHSEGSVSNAEDLFGNFEREFGSTMREQPSFVRRLRMLYGPSVMRVGNDRLDVNLASFQQVQLEVIQNRLLKIIFAFTYLNADTADETSAMLQSVKESRALMQDYVQAWKDLEFMTSFRRDKEYDPFLVSTKMTSQRAALRDEVESWRRVPLRRIQHDLRAQFKNMDSLRRNYCGCCPPDDSDGVIQMGGGTRTMRINKRWIEDCTKKVLMAVTGGAFLIAPMLIMVLHPGMVTSLITTSVFVFTFGLAMSLSPFLDKPFDVLSATAAYAAVLVVFIGTGGGS